MEFPWGNTPAAMSRNSITGLSTKELCSNVLAEAPDHSAVRCQTCATIRHDPVPSVHNRTVRMGLGMGERMAAPEEH